MRLQRSARIDPAIDYDPPTVFMLDESSRLQFRDQVERAGLLTDAHLAIDCVHEALQDSIDLQQPRCDASGRCCRFEAFGHRLFITTLEMGRFVASMRENSLQLPQTFDGTGCPYQVNGRCGVHSVRPFGCRIFFCDPTAEDWQVEQYERLHRQIKRMHDQFEIGYFYVEWREALSAVGLLPLAASRGGERKMSVSVVREAASG